MKMMIIDGSVAECQEISKLFKTDKSKGSKATKAGKAMKVNGTRTRKCRYVECREPFKPGRSNQYYCSSEHRTAQNYLNTKKKAKTK